MTGLWRYALESYRLDESRTYVDPFWQLMLEDIQILQPLKPILYKRAKKVPGRGNERNLAIALGNMLSAYARNGFTTKQAMGYSRTSGLWQDIVNYTYDKGIGITGFMGILEKQLAIRRLTGKAA